jgi:hypothetical protein
VADFAYEKSAFSQNYFYGVLVTKKTKKKFFFSTPKKKKKGLQNRVARFFLVQTYQIGENVTDDHKLYQTAINYTKWP